MSTFLGAESTLISLGATPTQVRDQIGTALTSRSWQIVAKGVSYQSITSSGWTTPAPALDHAESVVNTGAGSIPCTIVIQLQAAGTIAKYDVVAEQTGQYSYCPKSWTVEWADASGGPWTVAHTVTNEVPLLRGERRTYTVGGTPGAHVWWRLNVSAGHNGTTIYLGEWRPWLATGEFVSVKDWLYVIPPATETIGNANSRDVAALSFSPTTISLQAGHQYLQDMPTTWSISEKTAGAVAAGLFVGSGSPFAITASISGTTLTVTATAGVLQVGSIIYGVGIPPNTYISALGTGTGGNGTYTLWNNCATSAGQTCYSIPMTAVVGATGTGASTAKDNLRALYVALKSSVDSRVTDYDWYYQKPSPQNADDTSDWIVGVRHTMAPFTISPSWIFNNGNVNTTMSGLYTPAAIPAADQMGGVYQPTVGTLSITTDLVNGFIYYLQVNARGFAIATKTNANYFGPLHAAWGTHSTALSVMPTTFDLRWCGVNELLVGYDGLASSNTSVASCSKFMGLTTKMSTAPAVPYDYNSSYSPSLASGFRFRDQFCDTLNISSSSPYFYGFNLVGSGIFAGTQEMAADDFQIHRMTMQGVSEQALTEVQPTLSMGLAAVVPMLDVTDWYKFRGTATNESLALVADTISTTTLGQVMDATTAYTTLTLASTAGLASAGYVIIENEIVQYTGIAGSTLTGVTRARYGTVMSNHWSGDNVYQGLWFTIINGGALLFGTSKPS